MFHIAIVDDNEMCLEMTAEMMQQYIYENSATDITFTCFHTPFDLMDSVEAGAKYDTFLLDIVMPGMSGIEIAKELHQMGIGVPVIFLTSEKRYALEAFRVGATQYLVKGFTYAELKETLDRSVRIVSRERRRQIILNTREGYRHVFCRNILYAVANRNYQNIVLDNNNVLEVRMSHKALTEKLTQSINFLSIGSSYIINMFWVTEMSADSITMIDSFFIQIPQRQMKAVGEAYRKFLSSLARERPDFRID